MLKRRDRVDALLRDEQRRTPETDAEHLTRGLAVFAALWQQAELLGRLTPEEWQEDIEADLAIARAIDGRAGHG